MSMRAHEDSREGKGLVVRNLLVKRDAHRNQRIHNAGSKKGGIAVSVVELMVHWSRRKKSSLLRRRRKRKP